MSVAAGASMMIFAVATALLMYPEATAIALTVSVWFTVKALVYLVELVVGVVPLVV